MTTRSTPAASLGYAQSRHEGWGAFEVLRQKAEQLLAERKARGARLNPPKPKWAIGSMEWLAEQNKSS